MTDAVHIRRPSTIPRRPFRPRSRHVSGSPPGDR
jgi:hypothetical protein